mmetsp:Transcript_40975/g.85788  ORF Transcript_40975/g.85788 Transcript_40975/m.85788 type:complete len:244 (-) Transcript_40975:57-788(-)
MRHGSSSSTSGSAPSAGSAAGASCRVAGAKDLQLPLRRPSRRLLVKRRAACLRPQLILRGTHVAAAAEQRVRRCRLREATFDQVHELAPRLRPALLLRLDLTKRRHLRLGRRARGARLRGDTRTGTCARTRVQIGSRSTPRRTQHRRRHVARLDDTSASAQDGHPLAAAACAAKGDGVTTVPRHRSRASSSCRCPPSICPVRASDCALRCFASVPRRFALVHAAAVGAVCAAASVWASVRVPR